MGETPRTFDSRPKRNTKGQEKFEIIVLDCAPSPNKSSVTVYGCSSVRFGGSFCSEGIRPKLPRAENTRNEKSVTRTGVCITVTRRRKRTPQEANEEARERRDGKKKGLEGLD